MESLEEPVVAILQSTNNNSCFSDNLKDCNKNENICSDFDAEIFMSLSTDCSSSCNIMAKSNNENTGSGNEKKRENGNLDHALTPILHIGLNKRLVKKDKLKNKVGTNCQCGKILSDCNEFVAELVWCGKSSNNNFPNTSKASNHNCDDCVLCQVNSRKIKEGMLNSDQDISLAEKYKDACPFAQSSTREECCLCVSECGRCNLNECRDSAFLFSSENADSDDGISYSPFYKKEKLLFLPGKYSQSDDEDESIRWKFKKIALKSRSLSEPSSQYTTVLKPRPLRPTPVCRNEHHNSIQSLLSDGSDVFRRIGRLSAFQERPQSSLSSHDFERMMPSFSHHVREKTAEESEKDVCKCSVRVSSLTNVSQENHNFCRYKKTVHKRPASQNEVMNCDKMASCKPNDLNNCEIQDIDSTKRHSMPWDIFCKSASSQRQHLNSGCNAEPIHMTLEEVRNSLQSPPSRGSLHGDKMRMNDFSKNACKHSFVSYLKWKKGTKESDFWTKSYKKQDYKNSNHNRKEFSIKNVFSNLFKPKKTSTVACNCVDVSQGACEDESQEQTDSPNTSPFANRALPPLPPPLNRQSPVEALPTSTEPVSPNLPSTGFHADTTLGENIDVLNSLKMDYAASIERVKDCGWYWGPISGETAEQLLSNEPDGSFVVRDSSDEHYIFSLTFKLNGLVRHVRIEHDHGNFSFGCLQKFKSNTIVDFIENAVEHSRSGRYLFFLHRRPVLGPMRVQLLHPVSRFKQVQSLQHMCRFIILKMVRRDLIDTLPLPKRLRDYLNAPNYYSEDLSDMDELKVDIDKSMSDAIVASIETNRGASPTHYQETHPVEDD